MGYDDGREVTSSSRSMDLPLLLTKLARKRPLFHSEADFQHALAWEIRERYPDARLRLEYRPALADTRIYVDIWVAFGDGTIATFELKYKTRRLDLQLDGETYGLLDQGAQDIGRYDLLKDVLRLERLASTFPAVSGVAILLTNDSTYWMAPRTNDTVDAAFRLHEGRTFAGRLAWGPGASAGTMRAREVPINLATAYDAGWRDYSSVDTGRNDLFRYLLVNVSNRHGG